MDNCLLPDSSHRLVAEWSGGTIQYWYDDIESCAVEIWKYLSEFAHVEAKTKEAVTAALGARNHANVSLIINDMCSLGMLREVQEPAISYIVADTFSQSGLGQAFRQIASQLDKRFRRIGFEIKYSVRYKYPSFWDKIKMRSFWLALIAIVLSLINLVLTILFRD